MIDNVLFVIAARSGSKSIPNKNIILLGGIPLLAYRIKQALELTSPQNVWLSTDSIEYAEIGKQYGATVPYLRPNELATDSSSSNDLILDIIKYCDDNSIIYDAVALLEPTSPFVASIELMSAISLLLCDNQADSIVATKEVHTNSIFVQNNSKYLTEMHNKISNAISLRRQDFPKQITPSGGFYISKWNAFKSNKSFYTPYTLSYTLPDSMALEIDNPIDFKWAEFLINYKKQH